MKKTTFFFCFCTLLALFTVTFSLAFQNQAQGQNGSILERMSKLEENYEKILKNQEKILEGNPWKKWKASWNNNGVVTFPVFMQNYKKWWGETHQKKYEYAVYRNSDFRKLTISNWNSGLLVMTSPHMTQDKPHFKLGGSLWIYDTKDPKDDQGVYHYYYEYTSDGVKAPTTLSGNGLNSDTNKIVYRRLRK